MREENRKSADRRSKSIPDERGNGCWKGEEIGYRPRPKLEACVEPSLFKPNGRKPQHISPFRFSQRFPPTTTTSIINTDALTKMSTESSLQYLSPLLRSKARHIDRSIELLRRKTETETKVVYSTSRWIHNRFSRKKKFCSIEVVR